MECSICHSSPIQQVARLGCGADLYRCPSCALELLWPQLSDAALAELYSAAYYRAWGLEGEEPESLRMMKRVTARRMLQALQPFAQPGPLLDVGCAAGAFLEEAQAWGYDAHGIEFSAFSAAIAAAKVPAGQLHQGTLDDYPDRGLRFAVIIMSDLLEHVRDPRKALAQAAQLLLPGGILLVSTPDTRSWSRRLMGYKWTHYKAEHFYYFNRHNLSMLAASQGLELLDQHKTRKALNLDYVYHQFRIYPHRLFSPLSRWVKALLPARWLHQNLEVHIGEMSLVFRKTHLQNP